jgi:hypothetical protein
VRDPVRSDVEEGREDAVGYEEFEGAVGVDVGRWDGHEYVPGSSNWHYLLTRFDFERELSVLAPTAQSQH